MIEFREYEKPKIPESKTILIGGKEVGEATPDIRGNRLVWHAVIKIGEPLSVHTWLIQGHGQTPESAIANGVASARKQRDLFATQLTWLEEELGTNKKTSEELTSAHW